MTCRQLIAFLSDYYDGTLPVADRAAFDQHVGGCLECRQYVEQFKQTVKMVNQLGRSCEPTPLPGHLVEAILKAVEDKK
ncbi:MAG TPA: zf-HC2 domain-containing protein [Tepidisphaeraceae bacterium]|nr:zf-HC2 domain-containing protein [Tepidisphaeraceae bacterium]